MVDSGRVIYNRILKRIEIDNRLRLARNELRRGSVSVDVKGYLDGLHAEVDYEIETGDSQ